MPSMVRGVASASIFLVLEVQSRRPAWRSAPALGDDLHGFGRPPPARIETF